MSLAAHIIIIEYAIENYTCKYILNYLFTSVINSKG